MTGFLSELFSKLLIMSISASIVIIAIIFLRFILYKAPKSAVCVLWSLAAIRLILPFSIESSFSLMPSERNIGSALTAVSDGIGKVKEIFEKILQKIQSVFSKIDEWFKEKFQKAWDNITEIFSSIGNWFSDRWNEIKTSNTCNRCY